jgi:Transposase, Mutator family
VEAGLHPSDVALADVQLCVVHLVRSSLRYTSKKHWGQVCREMRKIYAAPTLDATQARFDEFAERWRERYPAMIDTWERAWGEFTPSSTATASRPPADHQHRHGRLHTRSDSPFLGCGAVPSTVPSTRR